MNMCFCSDCFLKKHNVNIIFSFFGVLATKLKVCTEGVCVSVFLSVYIHTVGEPDMNAAATNTQLPLYDFMVILMFEVPGAVESIDIITIIITKTS